MTKGLYIGLASSFSKNSRLNTVLVVKTTTAHDSNELVEAARVVGICSHPTDFSSKAEAGIFALTVQDSRIMPTPNKLAGSLFSFLR